MPNEIKQRKLKNIDDMIDSFGGVAGVENLQHTLDITSLVPFSGHPFSIYEGERLDDMVESIKTNGILVPIIVRKNGSTSSYEILSGHNRVNAGKLAGLTEIPAIVLDDVSDEEAMVYVVETNLMQRSFADMKHTEKAAAIAMHQSKMFSQGKRNDIIEFLKMMDGNTVPTSPQIGAKLRTDEKIGEIYGLSKNTVARYIRFNKLSDQLKRRVDTGDLGFIPAVTLSYLTEKEQSMIDTYLDTGTVKINLKKAEALRGCSSQGSLDKTKMQMILENAVSKDNMTMLYPSIKVKPKLLEKYFSIDEPVEKIEEVFELALEFYFKNAAQTKKG
jgi:ParB family chromosome partitioning protein